MFLREGISVCMCMSVREKQREKGGILYLLLELSVLCHSKNIISDPSDQWDRVMTGTLYSLLLVIIDKLVMITLYCVTQAEGISIL